MIMGRIFLAMVVSGLLLLGAASLLVLSREEDIDPLLMPEPPPVLRLPTNPRITIEGGECESRARSARRKRFSRRA
jgi:hypothetical protein